MALQDQGQEVDKVCIYCNKGLKEGDALNHIGHYFKPGEEKKKKHPLDTIIEHASKLGLSELLAKLETKKLDDSPTYIHFSCRNFLKNNSCSKRKGTDVDSGPSKRVSTRSEVVPFDFKKQCFYCGSFVIDDDKHSDRSEIHKVETLETKIHAHTLDICKGRNDLDAKNIERRLLNVSDLVAAEARYHKMCRVQFEYPIQKPGRGRPISVAKIQAFENMCSQLEDDMDLYTVADFQEAMETKSDDVYSVEMTKIKLIEKYGENITFVNRHGKSDIILLSDVNAILTESWYSERKSQPADEAQRIIIAAAKLLKSAIKNHEHITEQYPSTGDILDTTNKHVPSLLDTFMNEMIKSNVAKVSLSQAIFSCTHPRGSIMPLQLGLAVATDN